MIEINSTSVGAPDRFLSLPALEEGLSNLPSAGEDNGRVALLMRRAEGGRREILDRAELNPETGVPGDSWARSTTRKPDMQIAVMQRDVAELIANGQPLTLFGDCLILELDLSIDNLPVGSRVQVGNSLLEVTPEAHNGCKKFRARFGADALRFVSMRELRRRNLRGIYMRVVDGGEVAADDSAVVRSRGQPLRTDPFGDSQGHREKTSTGDAT